MAEFVSVSTDSDGVATIRVDRTPVNALNPQVWGELGEAAVECDEDDGIAAVVLWGGPKVFAAGADIKEMAALDATGMYRYIGRFQDAFTRLERLGVITIAAINGYALGGGCELALACDFRVAASDATLGQPEILLGVIPGAGGTQRLPRLIGVARAKDIICSGRFVEAEEALSIGLVQEVVAPSDVYSRAVEMGEGFARGPTVALMAAKRSIQHGLEVDEQTGLLLERQAFAALFATEDQSIGMTSFVERGPGKAKFIGR